MSCYSGPSVVLSDLQLDLDAANPKSYVGSGTTWTDLSGNGNTGTLTNGVTYSSTNGGTMIFDGTNDYVSVTVTKSASCTFSCWAKTITIGATPMLFNAGPNGSGPDLFFSGGTINWNIWDSNANPFCTIPASVTDGNWHHYAVVNDSASTAKLYYDSVLIGSATYRSAAGSTTLTIGGNDSTYMWNGSIPSFVMHNRALTPAEVTQNFNAARGRFGL